MKKSVLMLLMMSFLGGLGAQEIKKLWEVTDLEAPESVVYDAQNDRFIVSNVSGQPAEKNGMGFLSLVDKEGKILTKKWVSGFNAPKGLGLHKELLYVADIDQVVVVNINSGEIVKKYAAEGATFLNDIEIDSNGTVYISDTFGGNAIYKIENEQISLWLKDERLNYPNGLRIHNGEILVASWGVVTNPETFGTEVPGRLLAIRLTDKKLRPVSEPAGNFDGLELFGELFLVSDWIAGGLKTISNDGEVKDIIDLNPGSADIHFVSAKNLLLVPQMLDGKLAAYSTK